MQRNITFGNVVACNMEKMQSTMGEEVEKNILSVIRVRIGNLIVAKASKASKLPIRRENKIWMFPQLRR